MKTILNIKTDKEIKTGAQKTAAELGVPLSTVVNSFLKQFVRDKTVTFSTYAKPSPYLQKIIAEAREDLQSGKAVGPFDSVHALMKSLHSK